jgi:hypothetical protein
MLFHKLVEDASGNQFEQIVENDILVAHSVVPIPCPDDS